MFIDLPKFNMCVECAKKSSNSLKSLFKNIATAVLVEFLGNSAPFAIMRCLLGTMILALTLTPNLGRETSPHNNSKTNESSVLSMVTRLTAIDQQLKNEQIGVGGSYL